MDQTQRRKISASLVAFLDQVQQKAKSDIEDAANHEEDLRQGLKQYQADADDAAARFEALCKARNLP